MHKSGKIIFWKLPRYIRLTYTHCLLPSATQPMTCFRSYATNNNTTFETVGEYTVILHRTIPVQIYLSTIIEFSAGLVFLILMVLAVSWHRVRINTSGNNHSTHVLLHPFHIFLQAVNRACRQKKRKYWNARRDWQWQLVSGNGLCYHIRQKRHGNAFSLNINISKSCSVEKQSWFLN